ncbi:ABC transporter substrate-binding protein [Geodermatophilus sabuli]|uniref:ABC transporter substrate-binding protein n=1 Tax=Geodermatophilus sabuli TaxID=1564158 RepID=A0A7K3W3X4_9ACTN|nr:ABC transporter substrate-binding protein [Geodermatophilus sabuli]NEK59589.1 ABC transporter substrate-binding protein [Geodermatophilus sabuli]
MRGRARFLSAVSASVLLLTGCGDDAPESATSEQEELTPVAISILGIADTVPVYMGVEQGFFEEEGIDLTVDTATSGASIVPLVVNGEVDLGFGNALSVLVARSKGLPLQIVSQGAVAADAVEDGGNALLVRPDAGIETAADLQGTTIAVTSLGNLGQLLTVEWMKAEGADPSQVEFVEMSWPDMLPAMEAGQIDGGNMVEPFQTLGVQNGMQLLTDPAAEALPGGTLAVYFGSEQFMTENADVAERFDRAMRASLEYALDNADEARDALAEHLEMEPALAAEIALPTWDPDLNDDSIRRLAEIAEEQGVITESIDYDLLLP